LRKGVDANDASIVQKAAHSLKSSSANLGALQLAQLCKELENRARLQTLDQADSIMLKLENGYATVQGLLQTELRQKPNADNEEELQAK